MKNYIELLTDDEIKSYILKYLKITGWEEYCQSGFGVLSLNKIDDIVLKREENFFSLELYFKHTYKTKSYDIHSKHIYLDGESIRIYEEFNGNSFNLAGLWLSNRQVDRLIFGDKEKGLTDEYGDVYYYSISEDLNKYWNYQLYKKFGKEYLEDLKTYRKNKLKEEYNKKEGEIDKDIKSITKEREI